MTFRVRRLASSDQRLGSVNSACSPSPKISFEVLDATVQGVLAVAEAVYTIGESGYAALCMTMVLPSFRFGVSVN